MRAGIYIFCLSNEHCPDLPDSSSELNRLFLHRHGDLCAIAKRVSLEEFCGPEADRRLEDPAWVTPRAIDHGRVIAEVFRRSPVLPVPFGTLFSSPHVLEEFLERNAALIREFFEYAGGCEEWGIKGLLDRDRLKRSLIESNTPAESAAASPGLRYMRERRAEQMASQQSSEWLDQNLGRVAHELDQCATRSCQRRILGDSILPDGREEVLNLAALLARDRVTKFRRRIETINRAHADDGLSFAVTGPWPPYSFCPALDSPR
jgi:Gas vesicle synthesis protein GvpL/GvpF